MVIERPETTQGGHSELQKNKVIGLKNVNKVVLGIALFCIGTGTVISALGIWGFIGDKGLIWRSLATLAVVFIATILTFTVNNMITDKKNEEKTSQ